MGVFDSLILVDVLGQPQAGDVTLPGIRAFVESIFGCYDEQTGRRLIREFFLLISKKNSKSTTAAFIMLTVLILNWRNSAEFLILAPTKEVADNSFFPARDAVRADPALEALMQVQDHIRTITHRETRATLKIVAADSESAAGKKATGILVDELWLFGNKPKADAMFREATGGLASRPEGFVIYLSTQSDAPPQGVFDTKLKYARSVRDGRIKDPEFLPVLYEFPPKYLKNRDYLKPENFYITNPNIGASVDEKFLLREFGKAQEEGPEQVNVFLAKHLNVEIGQSLMSNRWAGADYWQNSSDVVICLDHILENCEVVTVGIDGGGLDDLLGLTVIGRSKEDARDLISKKWLAWSHAWAHPDVLDRRKEIAPAIIGFKNDGDLTLVDKIGNDVDDLAAIIKKIDDFGLLNSVGIDQIGISGILDALEAEKIDKNKLVAIPQGWRLAGAIKTAERRLAANVLQHSGSRLMSWCVGNARIETRANSTLVTKQASGTAKIDPLMALFNAVELMALNPKAMTQKFQFMVI